MKTEQKLIFSTLDSTLTLVLLRPSELGTHRDLRSIPSCKQCRDTTSYPAVRCDFDSGMNYGFEGKS